MLRGVPPPTVYISLARSRLPCRSLALLCRLLLSLNSRNSLKEHFVNVVFRFGTTISLSSKRYLKGNPWFSRTRISSNFSGFHWLAKHFPSLYARFLQFFPFLCVLAFYGSLILALPFLVLCFFFSTGLIFKHIDTFEVWCFWWNRKRIEIKEILFCICMLCWNFYTFCNKFLRMKNLSTFRIFGQKTKKLQRCDRHSL